ncbi:hypothetical protein TNCV_4812491 [Trichonephila clavipes]|nr:hypothetical protein TNCV_4812491 [Trichonephila clavipes]
MSVFVVHSSTPPPTMEPNKGRQPAGHLTCVRHGTYLRGEPVLESAELITSRLTGAGSLLPPVYGEAWAKLHATGTPDSTFPESQKAYDRINAKEADISEALANASVKKAAAEEKKILMAP